MRYYFIFLFSLLLFTLPVHAQSTDVWTLQRCVQYALDHNISIRQNELNERLAALTLKQSRLSQIPTANLQGGYGRSFGRSIDPTSNQFVNSNYDYVTAGGSANVLLFGWFQTRNLIRKNDLNHQASIADLDQLRDDVSLNVATGFLRAILAKEQIGVNQKQVALSEQQYIQTKKFAEAGRLPELNVAQLTSQLATDSANLIGAISDYTASLLDLKALLNLDFEVPFDIEAPKVDMNDIGTVLAHTPNEIYKQAEGHFGGVKSANLKLAAAQRSLKSYKGQLYPYLSFNAQLGSNFATTYKDYSDPYISSYNVTSLDINNNGTYTPVQIRQPVYGYTTTTIPLGKQLDNNLRQTYTLNLNIPIFNAWQTRYAVGQARINVESQGYNLDQVQINLQQNVYKAHNDARNSIQKYAAAQRADDAAREAYNFAQKRYDLGLTSTVDYLTTQNNQYRADASLLSARYDLIFRLKVIDYYLGKPLKL